MSEIALIVSAKPPYEIPVTYKKTVEANKKVKRIDHDNAAGFYCDFGVTFIDNDMYNEAIEAFKQAINMNYGYEDAHYNLGISYLILGNSDSAFEEYKILRDLDSQKADNLYNTALQAASFDKKNKFALQVGAFKVLDNAKEMLEKLKTQYLYAYIEKENNFNMVRLLGIKTKKEGRIVMNELYKKYKFKPYLLNSHKHQ
jgi:tetratricopeptide (TPR) repeat protein